MARPKKTPAEKPPKPKSEKKPSPRKGKKLSVWLDNPTPETKHAGGRPSEFEEAAPKIIQFIRNGNTYECASGCARVSYGAFAKWMRKGREDEENGIDSKFVQFVKDVKQAETDCENEIVGYWRNQIPMNWQAGKEFLARRHPNSWASKDKVDVTSNGETIGKPVFLPLKGSNEKEEE